MVPPDTDAESEIDVLQSPRRLEPRHQRFVRPEAFAQQVLRRSTQQSGARWRKASRNSTRWRRQLSHWPRAGNHRAAANSESSTNGFSRPPDSRAISSFRDRPTNGEGRWTKWRTCDRRSEPHRAEEVHRGTKDPPRNDGRGAASARSKRVLTCHEGALTAQKRMMLQLDVSFDRESRDFSKQQKAAELFGVSPLQTPESSIACPPLAG
jgi:hypothetical protein